MVILHFNPNKMSFQVYLDTLVTEMKKRPNLHECKTVSATADYQTAVCCIQHIALWDIIFRAACCGCVLHILTYPVGHPGILCIPITK